MTLVPAPTPPPPRLAWLPNAISVLRLVLVPVWFLAAERTLVPSSDPEGSLAGRDLTPLLIWLAIGISDVLDGHLARRWHVESRAGATIDAVADKAAQIVAFTWLALRAPGHAWMTAVPLWFLLLLIARDAVLLTGSLYVRARRGGVAVVHRWHGKLASLLLFAVVPVATSLDVPSAELALFAPLALLVTLSTVDYFRDGLRQLPRGRHPPQGTPESPR